MEAGVAEFRSPVSGEVPDHPDGDPRDIIELNYDIYKPSTTYSQLDRSIQKDMALANLDHKQVQYIHMCYETIDACIDILKRKPEKYAEVNEYLNKLILRIIRIVSISRGEDGFTAKLMRKTIHEQRGTMSYEMGREKKRESAVGKGKNFLGM